ncbi:MAG: MFS transporter [Proteobacteria bacterium]|nr:MFS transporter [Pseudomonadota bacterium]
MKTSLVLRIFVPFALGYCVVSILRSINAVIAPYLVRDLDLSATELGFATSTFFLIAVLMQIPYGVLLDRYDPRKLYALFLFLCAIGAVIAAMADGVLMLTVGRGLIALGGGASAVTSYKIYSLWFPPERLPLANGLSLAAGGLGVLIGTTPVELALQIMDWRDVHLIVAGLTLAAACVVVVVAPENKPVRRNLTLGQQISGLGFVLKSLVFWRAAPLTCMTLGTFGGVSTLWTGPWVRDVAGLSGTDATNVLLCLSAAFTVSSLLVGWMTGLARRAGLSLMGFVAGAATLFLSVLIALYLQPSDSFMVIVLMWSLFGFLGPLNMVSFAALAGEFPSDMTGRLNACLSVFWLGGGFAMQNIYAIVIHQFPSDGGSYAVDGHKLAIGLIALLLAGALVWFAIATRLLKKRPSNCQPSICL